MVGAGTAGAGIARMLADLGSDVVVVAARPGGVQRAAARLQRCYQSDVIRGRISPGMAATGLSRMHVTSSYRDLAGVECVIESVSEDLPAKHAVLAAVEDVVAPDCIIASNTSSIPITRIAAMAAVPDRIIGTHYFWPAYRYRLVEIAAAETTSRRTVQRALAMTSWQGKLPLVVRDVPGFFTTRVLLVYLNEAIALVTEGASVESVDRAMEAFGWAMGPFRLMDAVGIEIFRGIHRAVSGHLGDRVGHLQRLWPVLEAGHGGYQGHRREGVKGFYLYPGGQLANAQIYALIGQDTTRPPAERELSTRPIWQMVNEIGRCLGEGVVSSPEDADRGATFGLGWPQRHGGPMQYARRVGIDRIADQLLAWTRQYGPRFAPSEFLARSLIHTER